MRYMLACRPSYQAGVVYAMMDANVQVSSYLGYQLLTCPDSFLVVGYQARAGNSGISYLDVSPISVPFTYAEHMHQLPAQLMTSVT